MEEEHGTFTVDFGAEATPLNSATVRLTVTIVKDGEEAVSREFVAETAGNARSTRAPHGVCNALVQDAQQWIESLKPARKRPAAAPVRVVAVPVNRWQRFLLSLAGLPTPTRTTVLVGPSETVETEIGDGSVKHTAAASISVDSSAATDTVSVAGNTSGSPYQLASDLAFTVTFDIRERLSDLRYELENAR